MCSEIHRVHRRATGIALLGASTILLAAAGETMWHGNASASEGRWAGPQAGVAAALPLAAPAVTVGAAASALASDAESEMLVIPDFKPFVFVPLEPRPGGGTPLALDTAAGVHINANGDVVASFFDSGGDSNMYFWRDSGLSNGSSILAGWQGPLKDEYGSVIDGYATGINAATDVGICGTRDDSSSDVAFYYEFDNPNDREGTLYDIGDGYAFDVNENGIVVGASDTGSPVAWSSGQSTVLLPPLTQNGGTAAYGVDPDSSTSPYIAGASEDSNEYVQAVVWYYNSTWQVVNLSNLGTPSQFGQGIDTNADRHVVGSIFATATGDLAYSRLWVYSSGPQWTQEDISSVGLATAINSEVYPEVVGYDPDTALSAALWVATDLAHSTFAGTTLDLEDMTIGLPDDLLDLVPTDINDDGEIVGMAEIDAATDYWIPFKIVPYDTDNDGDPDYRQIIHAEEDIDADNNWLIDKSETMRVGLYAAGLDPADTRADEIDDVQAVRLHLDSDSIELIANNSTSCENTEDALIGWRNSEDQKELIALIRTKYPTNDHFDYILTGQDKEDYLDALFCFAYRYAKDIDFIQFGNEIFGGPGEYKVQTSCAGGYQSISEVDEECYAQACQQVIDWMEEQIAVARMGSALAGRPLRFATPAFNIGHVILGKDGDLRDPVPFDPVDDSENRAAFAVQCIIDLGNRQQAWVDLHLHYDVDGRLEDALYYFTTPNQYTWDAPDWRTSLEWSSKPKDDWVGDPQNMQEYRKYFWTGDGAPTALWDNFVYDWGVDDQNGGLARTGFPDFDRDLGEMESNGLLHACYGEFQQGIVPLQDNGANDPGPPIPDAFDLTILRANAVVANAQWITDYTNLFTDLRGDFEEDNTAYMIGSFVPRPNAPTTDCNCAPRP